MYVILAELCNLATNITYLRNYNYDLYLTKLFSK